jgi:hypothetical protein
MISLDLGLLTISGSSTSFTIQSQSNILKHQVREIPQIISERNNQSFFIG